MRVRARLGLSLSTLIASLLPALTLHSAAATPEFAPATTQPVDAATADSQSLPDLSLRSDARSLLMMQADESVYAPPSPPTENDFVNSGGVNLDLKATYLDDYVFRGIDRNPGHRGSNLQFDGQVSLNLGRAPHPFVGLFVNVFNRDPISRFQEVRPVVGFDWTLRPVILSAGYTSYIFPSRENNQDTAEAFLSITLMDDVLLHREKPLLSPFVYAAYDIDRYDGLYLEGGIRHDFVLEDIGLTLTAEALAAYVEHYALVAGPEGHDTGFQRYQLGLIGKYGLNKLLNIPKRYGDWSINGYIYYTDHISNRLHTDTTLWGGAGIEFHY